MAVGQTGKSGGGAILVISTYNGIVQNLLFLINDLKMTHLIIHLGTLGAEVTSLLRTVSDNEI